MATKKSRSGFYEVKLNGRFDHLDHVYLPDADKHVVDEGILEAMRAKGVIEHVQPV